MNIIAPTWENLRSIFEGKITWSFISSPWFSTEGIEKLNNFLPDEKFKEIKKMEVWFRMNVEDHLLGITDYNSFLAFAERVNKQLGGDKFKLFASDGLHAKIYASDRKILITSANLTKKAFMDNIEVGVGMMPSDTLRNVLQDFMDEQRKHLNEVSIVKLKSFVDQLNSETMRNFRKKVSEILAKAQKHISLLDLKEKIPPHLKFPLR